MRFLAGFPTFLFSHFDFCSIFHENTCNFLQWQDELEAELEELEGAELEEQLLQPATTTPAAPVHAPTPAGRLPTRPAPQKQTAEEDELAALQAEMAL